MVAIFGFDKAQIERAVKDMYTIVANQPTAPLHFPVGPATCRLAGYSDSQVAAVPRL